MKLQSFYLVSLLTFIFAFTTISAEAAIHKTPTQKEVLTKGKKKPMKIFFKKVFSKKGTTAKDKTISKIATAAFIVGAASFFCLFAPLILSVGTGIWVAAAILAIIGDVLAITARRKIRKSDNSSDYGAEKTMATIGLILSLLTGLIPLALLFLVMFGL